MGAMLPQGVPAEEVLREITSFTDKDVDWRTGKVMTGLYDPGAEAHAVAVEAYTRFLPHNALYVNMYPSIGKMEKESSRQYNQWGYRKHHDGHQNSPRLG